MANVETFSGSQTHKTGTRWKRLMVEGICALLFGIIALAWPGLTFMLFLTVFGIYVFIEGLVMIVSALFQRRAPMAWENVATPVQPGSWMILLAEGVLSVIAGLLCLFVPHYSAQGFLYVIALWALFIGISALLHARERGWRTALIGVLALIVSLSLFFRSVNSAQNILWLIGLCAIFAGALLLWQSWIERRLLNAPVEPAS